MRLVLFGWIVVSILSVHEAAADPHSRDSGKSVEVNRNLGEGQAKQSSAAPKQNEGKQEQAETGLTAAPPAIETVEPVPSAEYNPPCPKGQDDRRSDLCAQWKAADSAADAAWWAKWQTFLSFAGIAGLLYSLHLTRTATRTAVDAYRAEQRPWVQITAIITSDMIAVNDKWRLWINVQLSNIGKGPAIDIDVKSSFLIVTDEEKLEDILRDAFCRFRLNSIKERDEAALQGEIVFPGVESDNPNEWQSKTNRNGKFYIAVLMSVTYRSPTERETDPPFIHQSAKACLIGLQVERGRPTPIDWGRGAEAIGRLATFTFSGASFAD